MHNVPDELHPLVMGIENRYWVMGIENAQFSRNADYTWDNQSFPSSCPYFLKQSNCVICKMLMICFCDVVISDTEQGTH